MVRKANGMTFVQQLSVAYAVGCGIGWHEVIIEGLILIPICHVVKFCQQIIFCVRCEIFIHFYQINKNQMIDANTWLML